jgi:hypothetical protein
MRKKIVPGADRKNHPDLPYDLVEDRPSRFIEEIFKHAGNNQDIESQHDVTHNRIP